jgi:hypothetical protein
LRRLLERRKRLQLQLLGRDSHNPWAMERNANRRKCARRAESVIAALERGEGARPKSGMALATLPTGSPAPAGAGAAEVEFEPWSAAISGPGEGLQSLKQRRAKRVRLFLDLPIGIAASD